MSCKLNTAIAAVARTSVQPTRLTRISREAAGTLTSSLNAGIPALAIHAAAPGRLPLRF
jgi:hypothetical protein